MKKLTILISFLLLAGAGYWLQQPRAGARVKPNKHAAAAAEPGGEAQRWEYEMLKDPRTGKIPVGIREAEAAFKAQLRAQAAVSREQSPNLYEFVGPTNMGGRTRSAVYDKRDDDIVLAGGVSGGVFRSTDGGTTWTRVSTSTEPHDVTCIVQDPRAGHEDVWYYSTGNAGRGNSASFDGGLGEEVAYYLGNGIYRSADNGITWNKITGSGQTGQLELFDKPMDLITRLAVDPTDGYLYVAASGAIYRGTPFQQFWTWTKVLGDGWTNVYAMTDVVINNNGTIYAAFSGIHYNYDGVWKSNTGNQGDWTRIAGDGSPSGWKNMYDYGRIVLAIPPSNQNQLWAAYYNSSAKDGPLPNADLFRYTYNIFQGSGSWTNKSAAVPDSFQTYTGYCLSLGIKPDNAAHIYLGGKQLVRILDGSSPVTSYTSLPHADIHSIGFKPVVPGKPNNKDTIILGSDGGVHRGKAPVNTIPESIQWKSMNNGYATLQYYFSSINQDPSSELQFMGGSQDNGTTAYAPAVLPPYGHLTPEGGDGFQCFLDSGFAYMTQQKGVLRRRNALGGETQIDPNNAPWNEFRTYFHMNPLHDNLLFYADKHIVYRTTAASTVSIAGWTKLNGCTFEYQNGDFMHPDPITVMGTTSLSNPALFIGTMHGTLARLANSKTATGSSTPVILNVPGIFNCAVSGIAVDPSTNHKVMFTVANYGVSSIYYSENALSTNPMPTWTVVEGNLSLPSARCCIIVNGPEGKEYYVGTSAGLFRTTLLDGASTVWTQEDPNGIGDAVVTSLSYRASDNKLLIGTHGNGMYVATLGAGARITPQQTNETSALSVYPNPVAGGQTINISSTVDKEQYATLELFDLGGRLITEERLLLREGANRISREAHHAPGVYILRLGLQTARIVIRE